MNDLPRVVAVHPNSEMYGSDRMFLMAVEALSDVSALTVVLSATGPLTSALREVGVEPTIRPFPVLRKRELTASRLLRFLVANLVATVSIARWLRHNRVEHLYVSTTIAPVWVLAGRLAGCHVVCHVHENEPEMHPAKRTLILAPLQMADDLIANSASTAHWLATPPVHLKRRTRIVLNGVAGPGLGSVTAEHRGCDAPLQLLVVGRLSHRKGQDVAVRALARLVEEGHDAQLELVGDVFPGYEEYRSSLEREVDALGLHERVKFSGYSDDVWSAYRDADIVLAPSRMSESFGNVAVEAQLSGRPIVASDVNGFAEVLEPDVTGVLVPPGDEAALAGAVARLSASETLRLNLAQSGRTSAASRFSPQRFQAEVAAVVLGHPG
jgi:glycosyltransferase involved in cell wall biosynthesis